ncbi:MAG TPA: DNA methyltransferase [Ktedonobacterales bacterium]|nr:DNA methyltransferase [Ktedonobacterales bacterium]
MTATGYVVADNMLAQLANPDEALLAALLQEQVNAGESLEALGYNADELDALLTQLADERLAQGKRDPDDPSGGGDDFDTTPDEDGPTRCQRGEIWQLGEHRLLCGDSTHAADVARLMGGETPDMVWSDPPYGINIVATNVSVGGGEAYDIPFGGVKAQKTRGDVGGSASHIRKTGKPYIAGKRLGSVGGAKPFGSAAVRGSDGAANMIDVGKYAPVIGDETTDTAVNSYTLLADAYPKAIHVWWGANYYANALPPSSCWIVWDKQNTGNFADAELAWCSHKSAVRIFQHMWSGLMKASEKGQRRVHPTQKPIALAAWAFEKYGAPGDVILDPFCGSGMSVVAAERTHRRCFAIEMSAAYCDVITHRWEVESGQTAVRISPAETPQTDE